jgi:hypothetical protein
LTGAIANGEVEIANDAQACIFAKRQIVRTRDKLPG